MVGSAGSKTPNSTNLGEPTGSTSEVGGIERVRGAGQTAGAQPGGAAPIK